MLLTMRYQVFNSRVMSANPVISAPWKWVAFMLSNFISLKWSYCRVIDSRTGETLLEWIKATKGFYLNGEKSSIELINFDSDDCTHTFLIGETRYGMSQPKSKGAVIPRDSRVIEINSEESNALTYLIESDEEPDLSFPIALGYKSTWGDKKSLCQREARQFYENGASFEDNPYIEGTWPHKWWSQEFSLCTGNNK